MRRAATLRFACVVVVAATATASADTRARLSVTGETCEPATLRASITTLLGHDGFVADGDGGSVDIELHVAIATSGDAVVGTIEIDAAGAEDGRRTITVASCAELYDAASLAIAMVLARRRAEPTRSQVIAPTPAPVPAPLEVEAAAPPEQRVPGLEMYGGVVGGRASGRFQTGLVIGANVTRGGWKLGADFALAAADRVTVGPGRVVVSTRTFDVAGCRARGSLAACATIAVGWVSGHGEDLPTTASVTSPYLAAGARLQWDAVFSARIAARIQLGARAPAVRNRFLVDEMPVWSTAPVEAWIGLALVARIP